MSDPLKLLPEDPYKLVMKDAFQGRTLPTAELVKEWPHEFKIGNDERNVTIVFKDKESWTTFIHSNAVEALVELQQLLEVLGPGSHRLEQQ